MKDNFSGPRLLDGWENRWEGLQPECEECLGEFPNWLKKKKMKEPGTGSDNNKHLSSPLIRRNQNEMFGLNWFFFLWVWVPRSGHVWWPSHDSHDKSWDIPVQTRCVRQRHYSAAATPDTKLVYESTKSTSIQGILQRYTDKLLWTVTLTRNRKPWVQIIK